MGKFIESTDDIDEKENIAHSKMETNVENGIYYIKNNYIEIKKRCKKLFDDAKVYDKFDSMMHYMLSNPLLLVGFIIITAVLVIPILVFTIFAVINVAIAFTTFIIIEVIILMIGVTVLICVMFFIVTTVVVTGLSFILSFYITYFSFSLVRKKIKL